MVRGRDVAQLADRVARLLADRDLARQLGAAGRAWVEREWRWEAQAGADGGACSGASADPGGIDR